MIERQDMQTKTVQTSIHGCRSAVIIASLCMLLFGCATVKPTNPYQADITKLAVVSLNQPPEIRFEGFSRSKGEGALEAMGGVLAGSFQGRELGILLLPITLPVGAAVGAALAPSADKVKHAEDAWKKDFANRSIIDNLNYQVVAAAKNNGAKFKPIAPDLKHQAVHPGDYKFLADAGIDTVLELVFTKISAAGKGLDAPLSLHISARARLLRTKDRAEIFSTDAEFVGDRHTRSEWEADHSNLLLRALSEGCAALGRHIYENVFMLYPFPDQDWHTSFPRGTLGLATIDPPLGFSAPKVKNLRPLLRWQRFPRKSDIKNAPEDMGRVKNVRYDLFVAELIGGDPRIIYRREGLPTPEHAIEKTLKSGTGYSWSVRARFELDGRERLTEWSGLALGLAPKLDRRRVPPFGSSYIFETPR